MSLFLHLIYGENWKVSKMKGTEKKARGLLFHLMDIIAPGHLGLLCSSFREQQSQHWICSHCPFHYVILSVLLLRGEHCMKNGLGRTVAAGSFPGLKTLY